MAGLTEIRPAVSPARRAVIWVRAHPMRTVAIVAAFLLYSLALVELGHWLNEQPHPPLGAHLGEMARHFLNLAGVGDPAKYLWKPAILFIRWG